MRLSMGLVAGILLLACSSRSTESGTESTHAPSAAAHDAAVLPPGVIASAQGTLTEIRVEEQAGMRRLVIGDTVQGAIPVGANAGNRGPDPVVGVIRAVHPRARTALVIGLGTGTTTMDLRAAGMEVTAVEIEPKVIDFARAHFGYTGDVVRADGARFIRRTDQTWDVVLMDAFSGLQAPLDLVSRRAMRNLRKRTAKGGMTMVRALGEPRDHLFARMARDLRGGDRGARAIGFFGSGVGSDVQNLYLIATDEPVAIADARGLPVWPVRMSRGGPAWAEPTATGESRRIKVLGYVVRLSDSGALALDLPHWEMGAARYLLTGEHTRALGERLPKDARFPTRGDIRTDGDVSTTLHAVLGGGGAKRSDVRFSQLAVLVEGTASLETYVAPDALAPAGDGSRPRLDSRLPYGGSLYRLEVEEVHWTLDSAAWTKTTREADRYAAAAGRHLRRGELGAAADELQLYATTVQSVLLPFMPPYAEAEAIRDLLREEIDALSGELGDFELAAACDRIASTALQRGLRQSARGRALVAELEACAVAHYEPGARTPRAANGIASAKRLLAIYARQLDDDAVPETARKAAESKLAALRKKYRVLHASPEPPPRSLDPPAMPPE